MKKQVIFISGGDAFSKHDNFLQDLRTKPVRNLPGEEVKQFWTTTLVEDLGDEYEVFMPTMPNKQNAKYDEWKIWFERYFEYLRDGVVLVGWSLGGMFLAKYLSEEVVPVKLDKLYLLGAPCGSCDGENGNDCGSFQFLPQTTHKIYEQVKIIHIMHAKDDFVVPYEHALLYKKHLNKAILHTFDDKNHFLIPDFKELIDSIKAKD